MSDSPNSRIQLSLDGVEQTQVGPRGNCTTTFQGPRVFSKMIIGWEQYTSPSDKAQDAWLDNLVASAQRIGCPAPYPTTRSPPALGALAGVPQRRAAVAGLTARLAAGPSARP